MRFVNVTDENFEDIFMVSAKFEQWEYVKHHIFDMVNNYIAIVNEKYLPIPFLVYENDSIIGFVQVNYDDKKSSYEICKIIVHETEQNKRYGTNILSEVINWLGIKFGQGTMTATYKVVNIAAAKLFSNGGFKGRVVGDEVVATMEFSNSEKALLHSEFEEIPYATVGEFAKRIRELKKYPENIIGDEKEIYFRKVNGDNCKQIIEMQLFESQEEYVMPFVDSLAQSYSDLFEEEITITYALCNCEKTVGLVEIRYVKGEVFPELKDKMVYELFRILVDKEYQKEGYGTKAVQLFLNYVKDKPLGDADDMVVSVVEGNDAALKLYEKFGFEIIGKDKYEHIALGRKI